MLIARSAQEARLYLELHPCACGESALDPEHWLEQRGEILVAVYRGTCPRCETQRTVEFMLSSAQPPAPPAFGGEQPSSIICPGEFLLLADVASDVPADLAALDAADRTAAVETLRIAAAALDEVLKFIPADRDAVPERAVTSTEGRELYRDSPGRFRRSRLEAARDSYLMIVASFKS